MQQITDWLDKIGMSEYAQRFAENGIDISVLRDLTDQDLRDISVLLGHRRKILRAIGELSSAAPLTPPRRKASIPSDCAAGCTGTGAAPVIAKTARELGILTIGVVTKPFHFEGKRRMRLAEAGIAELQRFVDTLLIIPNQNLFRVANEKTTFTDAFAMADQVLYSGVACITDLIVKEGLINLDYADVRAVMREKGKAMMGMGEASGEKRVLTAAEAAISNPLIEDPSIKRASGLLISITGGKDLTLFEVDEAASRIREEADQDANIIVGATLDDSLEGTVRVSVVATGIDNTGAAHQIESGESALTELAVKLRNDSCRIADRAAPPTMAEGVSLRPMTTPSLLDAAQIERSMPAASIPSAAERVRRRPQEPSDGHAEKRHMTLIQRLASVGLGRRAEAGRSAGDDAASRTIDPRNSTSHPSSYGRGYQHAISNSVDEGVLDIPAFLRRGTEPSP